MTLSPARLDASRGVGLIKYSFHSLTLGDNRFVKIRNAFLVCPPNMQYRKLREPPGICTDGDVH